MPNLLPGIRAKVEQQSKGGVPVKNLPPDIVKKIESTPGVKIAQAKEPFFEQLILPLPPSLNRYYRHVGSKVLISKGGRLYRKAVEEIVRCSGFGSYSGRIRVDMTFHPPDRRRRDLDNTLKASLDALQHAGVYEDDSQIDDLRIVRGSVVPGGRLTAVIRPI